MIGRAANRLVRGAGDIAVFGSAHVDIIGESTQTAATFDHMDHVGSVTIRLGGSAFNVAVDLARYSRHFVRLWTVLKQGSLVERWVVAKLRREGVGTGALVRRTGAVAGAYLANKATSPETHALVTRTATTSSSVNTEALAPETIRRIVRGAKAVVADCNLSPTQLRDIARVAGEGSLPLVVTGVSETKVVRFVEAAASSGPTMNVCLVVDPKILSALTTCAGEQGCVDREGVVDFLGVSCVAVFAGVSASPATESCTASFEFLFQGGRRKQIACAIAGAAAASGGRDGLAAAMAAMAAASGRFPSEDGIEAAFQAQAGRIIAPVLRDRVGPGSLAEQQPGDNFGIEATATSRGALAAKWAWGGVTTLAQAVAGLIAVLASLNQMAPDTMRPVTDFVVGIIAGTAVGAG